MNVIYTTNVSLPAYNRQEILRYMGMKAEDPQITQLFEDFLSEVEGKIKGRVCYSTFSIQKTTNGIDLGFTEITSKLLEKKLENCESILVFAATAGMEVDRLIGKYARVSPLKALFFDAIGSERVEAICDTFEEERVREYAENGQKARKRISPGYGDLPLSLQKEIFAVLDCPRKIGLTLNDSLFMSPSKSVTAIIGIQGRPKGVL